MSKIGITFGFVTNGANDHMLKKGIESVKNAKLLNYEIIVVGNTSIVDDEIKIIHFDESIKTGWITKKKEFASGCSK